MLESSVPLAGSGVLVAAHGQAPEGQFSAEELAHFEQHGFVIAKQLADAEVCGQMLDCTQATLAAPFGPLEYEADLHYPGAPGSRAAAGGSTIRRLKEVHGRHPVFTQFVSQPSLVLRLQQLLGPQVVMPLAHHNCVMTKQPRYSSETGWHQDIRYWSYERPELVSAWLALGRETADNGALSLIPGSHRLPISRDRLDAALFLRPELPQDAAVIAQNVSVGLDPGD